MNLGRRPEFGLIQNQTRRDLERDQEKHVPAKAGVEPGFPFDRATD
jgi:hypothetical protein